MYLSASLAARDTEIARILNFITNLSTGGGGGGGVSGGGNNCKATGAPCYPMGYCWTHGFKVRVCHSSASYKKCKDGHETHLTAKRGDIKGVCEWNNNCKPRGN